ncbi:hypothetical protein CLAFUW4_02406 [Fulvia fulva]|uniref:Heterokaryon incompatibility domain-containing protein n=1 Tax=Passalora fulva TaxID=5499 RepID=A0A9Q8L939_PASFU|nr:uncharacterized protein CLAFUR5_02394 [Fulvia fulva]KAK4631300.1 hypothetical protein CLAFUR4_02401 [Fulvia fulva]KAK4633951.1 hypothetical protein CLAFUR0_02405 [Fulvia fulva]UJO13190.1 hypothetical protein CLAFUR5_02394 [Fulvia fulva]WPV11538.1 hypothetical protein CLAFUW4_02406 [Fulvia fulva]WPV26405.1 hypothetical protein CLAFUW7_02406 [Fulvia fulva]
MTLTGPVPKVCKSTSDDASREGTDQTRYVKNFGSWTKSMALDPSVDCAQLSEQSTSADIQACVWSGLCGTRKDLDLGLAADRHYRRQVAHAGSVDLLKDAAETQQYRHEPLPGPGHIRVLVVQPAAFPGSPVICEIGTCRLDSSAIYQALSYSWATQDGIQAFERSIMIQSRKKLVTRNLFEALCRLRQPKDWTRLWVDAVCIDQDDDTERTHQVANMALIYKTSISVIVWLGEGETAEDDAVVLALLSSLGNGHSSARQVARHSFRSNTRREPHCRHTKYLQRLLRLADMAGDERDDSGK